MTPGNNGANTPEDDDPFGYLYADGQANGAQPPSGGYGYPNSVNRVRSVGQRQYGQQAPTAQYGQAPQPAAPQQGAYGQPNAAYAAPETFPGGAPTSPQQAYGGGGGGRGRGPNTKGLLIGAVAVVAAVVIGIGVAMMNGDDDKDDKTGNAAASAPAQGQSSEPSPSSGSSKGADSAKELPKVEAKALRLGGSAALASDVKGAQSDGGVYVNLNQVGNSVTWSADGIPSAGDYTLFAHYSTVDEDQSMTLTVNGKKFGTPMPLKNYTHTNDGDFEKGWTTTYAWPTLTKGTNTFTLSCENGDKCNVLLDKLYLKKGRVKG
ncbi:carbohydrate-binding protein [Streptomyces griseus]|uniref:carbohydrate-binding protein n=1 Tax=Streptomyces griseus TaxID=1911 RepID=UPI000560DDBF|nr:carbohydrate-binding protein [Streptomyces griseus]